MVETLGRFGTTLKNAHEMRRSRRVLDSFPPEIQKDIG
jgi:hypothetical protein